MPVSLASIVPSPPPLCIAFTGGSGENAAAINVDVPFLGGTATELIFASATPAPTEQGVRLFRAGHWLFGHAQEPFIPAELASRTEALYQRIFAATRGRQLYRIWNYVPEINAHTAGLEHYRGFCQGRSLAFESALGAGFQPRLPAASAVGRNGTLIDVIFAAGETTPAHHENPEQVPAYHYPIEHGPRAPSFARATVVREGGQTWTFISGTSAIKGHQTIAPGRLEAQLECTLDNLRLISRKSGLGDNLGADRATQRQFKVYLRHAADYPAAREILDRSLVVSGDAVTYLNADICRAALNVEIEATIVT
jgi:chorismate lyase/3-hydroxybenzoate synthase